MTRRTDDAERDAALARAWTEQSHEVPPPSLDQAILAAAHRAVAAGPQDSAATALARRPQRWWMPLAAAAVIGVVAVGVVQVTPETELLTPHEKLVATPKARSAPTPTQEPLAMKPDDKVAAPAAPERLAMTPREATPAPQPEATAERATAGTTAQAEARNQDADRARRTHDAKRADRARIETPPAPSEAAASRAPTPMRAMEAAPPVPPSAAPIPLQRDRVGKLAAAPEPFPGSLPAPTHAPERKAEAVEPREERQAGGNIPSTAPPPAAPTAPVAGRLASAPPSPSRDAAEEAESSRRVSKPVLQSTPTTLAKNADSEARAKARDPDAWLARIRKLRDGGDVDTAERELREFRRLIPDAEARIPADMRAWAASIR